MKCIHNSRQNQTLHFVLSQYMHDKAVDMTVTSPGLSRVILYDYPKQKNKTDVYYTVGSVRFFLLRCNGKRKREKNYSNSVRLPLLTSNREEIELLTTLRSVSMLVHVRM